MTFVRTGTRFGRVALVHVAAAGLVLWCASRDASAANPPRTGHHASVVVSVATELDWVFAVANQSPPQTPRGWLEGYDSAKQSYELYVPPGYDGRRACGAVIFISPGDKAAAAAAWQPACRELGLVFAAPHGAGNGCPMQRRVRIVLDVLHDLRRTYRLDADRTYLAGFSGGGRTACGIAFALPEYFGGVLPICAGGELREEPWLRHRVIDRLSVAHLTGGSDFNRGEVERWRHPMLAEVGVRSRVWVDAKAGHAVPASSVLTDACRWLDDGLPARQSLAKKFPAARQAEAADRAAWSAAVLAEARDRLKQPTMLYSGLMQLHGLAARWPDVPAAAQARKLLEEYDARTERPWEADDIAEQRRFLVARARGLDAYASGTLPKQYLGQRADMLRAAVELWKQVLADGKDAAAAAQARERIPKLEALLEAKKN